MKTIYKFNVDCGRSGNISGIFVAQSYDMGMLISYGCSVYFGEILGKHSNVYETIENYEITIVSDNQKDVEMFERLNLSTGINPFNYLYEDYLEHLKEVYEDNELLSVYLKKTDLFNSNK